MTDRDRQLSGREFIQQSAMVGAGIMLTNSSQLFAKTNETKGSNMNIKSKGYAAGVTGIARTTGASLSPIVTGQLLGQASLLNVPFFLAGSLKIMYDIMLYRSFRAVRPPEEKRGMSTDPGSKGQRT